MERTPFVSRAVNSIGYEESFKTLEIEYKSGDIYQYYEVPKEVYEQLIVADSIGKFVTRYIKPRYRYFQVR